MHKMYLEKIDILDHKEKIKEIIEMLLCDVKGSNYGLYEHINSELYEMAYGMKINEEMAIKWVESMKPIGRYWTIEETKDAMNELGYMHDYIDFFVVANMMKNDYKDLTEEDDMLALKLAHDWLNDVDSKECKLYQYWKHIIKRN